jgi:serine/threonine-protein kinase RsbW
MTETTDPDSDAVTEAVTVSVPADVSFVSTLRLTTASLAARCGLTVDDIEDLRLAVDEACSLLLPHASDGSTLDTRFVLSPGRLEVDTAVSSATASDLDRTGFAWTVLGALATSVDVLRDDTTLTITVTKQSETPAR